MVSGDDVLADQLRADFPGLEYAVVKTAKSLSTAEAVPRDEVDRRIETVARSAMEKFKTGKFQAYYLPPPYDFKLSFRTSEEAALAGRTRGVFRDGEQGVRFTSSSFVEGYDVAKDVISHATDPLPLLVRILEHEPDGKRILQQWDDLQWLQVDPQKLPDWSEPKSEPLKKQKYYGDQ